MHIKFVYIPFVLMIDYFYVAKQKDKRLRTNRAIPLSKPKEDEKHSGPKVSIWQVIRFLFNIFSLGCVRKTCTLKRRLQELSVCEIGMRCLVFD